MIVNFVMGGVDLNLCNRVFFSKEAENCTDSIFLLNCRNVSNCIGCVNLRNVSYHILNKPYTAEEFYEQVKKLDFGNYKTLVDFNNKFLKLAENYPRKYANLRNTVNVIGDNFSNFRNCLYCFNGGKGITGENCKYLLGPIGLTTNSYDIAFVIKPNYCYEVQSGSDAHYQLFNTRCNYCHHLQYSDECHSSSDLFGCIGLRHKEYCILNKQYSKAEYEELVPRIIDHMNKMPYIDKKGRVYKYGEFFPPELSPFAYNETIAQEYFPLTKEQAIAQGYTWYDRPTPEHRPTLKAKDLSDHIKDVPDTITNEIIECASVREDLHVSHAQCTTAFRIIPQELEFYRKMNLPLPRLCPNCRHFQRIKQRNPLKLWQRHCQCAGAKSSNGVYQNTAKHSHGDKLYPVVKPQASTTGACPTTFQTTYSPDRPEIVYCEACYLSEVV